jgi:membrane-associated phospholipid phosphatase
MDRWFRKVLLFLICCVVILSIAAHIFTMFPFDPAISRDLTGITNPCFAIIMQYVSIPGNNGIPVILIGGLTAFFVFRRAYLTATFMALTGTSVVIAAVLKLLVARPRPLNFTINPGDLFFFVDRYSYPSGHVLFYVVFFGFIAYISYNSIKRPIRWLVIFSCLLLIVLIAPSRIYLQAHWASDIIGSYIIGGLLLLLLVTGYRAMTCREKNDHTDATDERR